MCDSLIHMARDVEMIDAALRRAIASLGHYGSRRATRMAGGEAGHRPADQQHQRDDERHAKAVQPAARAGRPLPGVVVRSTAPAAYFRVRRRSLRVVHGSLLLLVCHYQSRFGEATYPDTGLVTSSTGRSSSAPGRHRRPSAPAPGRTDNPPPPRRSGPDLPGRCHGPDRPRRSFGPQPPSRQ